jgi:hypothetical protein
MTGRGLVHAVTPVKNPTFNSLFCSCRTLAGIVGNFVNFNETLSTMGNLVVLIAVSPKLKATSPRPTAN